MAIKRLRWKGATRDPSTIERLRREGEALRRLNHPNIVRVLAIASDRWRDQIVMEFVSGGSVADLLVSAQSLLPIERVLEIALDLCDALTRSHRLDIIHRDLKPSNVLLAEDGTPRLTDFGAAYFKGRTRITEERSIVGTIEYLSPEAFAGEDLDARADIWAFGVLLFEMLTCRQPFARGCLAQTLGCIVGGSPPDLEALRSDCPVALVDLVYRMLEKQRDQRIQSVRQVAVELDAILHPRDVPLPGSANERVSRHVLPNNLPAHTSTLVGRQLELTRLRQAFEDPAVRLVTIVAPGGMGKTRLALEFAQTLVAAALVKSATSLDRRAKDGVYFVQLTALASPDFILMAIAEALGIQFHPGREPALQLNDYLQHKHLLLLMDNFEHLLDGAVIVSDLLHAAAGLSILATSREGLGLTGEQLFPLDGLTLPEGSLPEGSLPEGVASSNSVGLFLQVARNLQSDFALNAENTADVVRVCRLVEGVPLGIILAASWVGTLGPGAIADEIANGLEFLSAEVRDLPERQRSMRAAFEHSWSLLSTEERSVLVGISVFRGGFTREAAQAIVGARIRSLHALSQKSLLRRDPGRERYEVHELLRQFAAKKLLESPERRQQLLQAHATYFARYVSQRLGKMRSPTPRHAVVEIEVELDNVRAAWTALVADQRWDEIATMLDGLDLFLTRRAALAEGEGAFRALVEALRCNPAQSSDRIESANTATEATDLMLSGLLRQATYMRLQGQYAPAIAQFREALDLLGENTTRPERAYALIALGSTEGKIGKLEEAKTLAEQGVALYRATTDAWNLASALETLGWLYGISGDLEVAERVYRETADLQRRSGYLPSALMGLGTVTADQGRYEQGCEMLQQALSLFETAGDDWNRLRCQNSLANAQRKLGNYAVAESLARSCLAFAERIGNWDHETWSRFQLGNILKEQGRFEEAAEQVRAAHERSLMVSDIAKLALSQLEFGDLALLQGDRIEAEQRLCESLRGFETSGHSWGVVLALDLLAFIDCYGDRWEHSRARFERALRLALKSKLLPFALNIVAGVAHLFARTGDLEGALEVLLLAKQHMATEKQTVTRRIEPLHRELRGRMSTSRFSKVVARGRALSLESVVHCLTDRSNTRTLRVHTQ